MGSAQGVMRPGTVSNGLRRVSPDETLGDASAALRPLRARVESRFTFSSQACPDLLFTIETGSEVSVRALACPDDSDPDGVLAPGGGALHPAPGGCWLKIRHEAGARFGRGATRAETGFHFSTDAPFLFADYRRHERAEAAVRAVSGDLRRPRFAQRLADVRGLRPDEALAFRGFAELRARAEVGWADVLAGGLGNLAGFVGARKPLSVEVGAAAVQATVVVPDEFTVVFWRDAAGAMRVAVFKAAARRAGFDTGVGMRIELADPQQLEEALQSAVAGLLEHPYAAVRAIVEASSAVDLDEAGKAAAEDLAVRLGFADLVNCFTNLQEKLFRLEGALAEAIAELATAKIAASFTYEYARIAVESPLLQAVVDDEALSRCHAALCLGDPASVIASVREGETGINLERYLHADSPAPSEATGFTLAAAPWLACGRQRRALGRVVQGDAEGRTRVACLGLGAYEGRWLDDAAEWFVDINLATPSFAGGGAPAGPDFAAGLSAAWRRRAPRLGPDEIDDALDAAVLWGVLRLDQVPDVRALLAAAAGGPAVATVQIILDDVSLRAVVPLLAAARDADFAAALAEAMPPRPGGPGRGDPSRRRELYGPLWGYFLEHPEAPARTLVEHARRYLGSHHEPDLGFLEESYTKVASTGTFVGLAKLANQATAAAWCEFRAGASRLQKALGGPPDVSGELEAAYACMAGLWTQAHHVRALGACLLEHARTAGVLDRVTRALTVGFGDPGRTLVVAAPSA